MTQPKLNAVTLIITPEQANNWLQFNNTENYRKLIPNKVNALTNDIINGRWELNGETIKFDPDGTLKDGQHRLMACVKSNTPIQTLVAFDVLETKAVDRGTRRTFSQDMVNEGVPNANRVAKIARAWFLLRMGKWGVSGQYPVTDGELKQFYYTNVERIDSAAQLLYGSGNILTTIVSGPLLCEATFQNFSLPSESITAINFVNQLKSGMYPGNGSNSVVKLRDRLLQNYRGNSRLTIISLRALVIFAWQLFVQGKNSNNLYYSLKGRGARAFPKILHAEV